MAGIDVATQRKEKSKFYDSILEDRRSATQKEQEEKRIQRVYDREHQTQFDHNNNIVLVYALISSLRYPVRHFIEFTCTRIEILLLLMVYSSIHSRYLLRRCFYFESHTAHTKVPLVLKNVRHMGLKPATFSLL